MEVIFRRFCKNDDGDELILVSIKKLVLVGFLLFKVKIIFCKSISYNWIIVLVLLNI